MLLSLQVFKAGADVQVFFCFALITNLIVSALLVLGGSAVITAVTGMSPDLILVDEKLSRYCCLTYTR